MRTCAAAATGASTEAPQAAAILLDAFRALERALRQRRASEARVEPDGAPGRSTSRPGALLDAERAVLHCLYAAEGPVSLGDLARRLHRDPSSACVTVNRLVTRRLVQKRRPREDQRRTLLSLTPAGRRWTARTPDRALAVLAQVLGRWPQPQVRAATALLAELAEAITTPTGPTRTHPARDAREVVPARPLAAGPMAARPTPARAPRAG